MILLKKIRNNNIVDIPVYSLTRSNLHLAYYSLYKEMESWSVERIEEWQLEQIKRIVEYAYENVPFYKRLYSAIGFLPGDLKRFEDFEKLPCITKDDIKKNSKEFESINLQSKKYRVDYTGGSTGQPMRFLVDESRYYLDEAFYRYYWEKTGYCVGKERCVILRGEKIRNAANNNIYEYNRFWRYMYIDSNCLELDLLEKYDDAIRKFGARVIQAYPSSLYMLAKLYQLSGKSAPTFDIVYFSSENVYCDQMELIKKVFNIKKFFNQYGHSEKVLVAAQGMEFNGLGFAPNYGYMELVDDFLEKVSDEKTMGEIVGTGFSKSMPFIRYKTSDCAKIIKKETDDFMRNWKKISYLEGRLHEFIYDYTGRKISVCTLGGAHIVELNSVLDMQYEQYKPGELLVHVVENPSALLTGEDKMLIEKKYEALFDSKLVCKVDSVNSIERTSRSKKVMLIQHYRED